MREETMPTTDTAYVAENTATRERLKALVARLSDDDLRRPLEEGWTVGATLAHIAFWDQRALRLLEKWERQGVSPSPLPADVDAINDAMRALCLAIPPRQAGGNHVSCKRFHHRLEHLEQLEGMFAGA